jgi:hypothetical protein
MMRDRHIFTGQVKGGLLFHVLYGDVVKIVSVEMRTEREVYEMQGLIAAAAARRTVAVLVIVVDPSAHCRLIDIDLFRCNHAPCAYADVDLGLE